MSRRRPLYPRAWGSGTKPFEATYKVFSVGAAGRSDLEAGDKIIMPEEAFKAVSRLRLEFPLHMQLHSAMKKGPKSKKSGYTQFSGVLEFSAPKGVAYIPSWMISGMNMREGGRVAFKSVKKLPKGDFARFQPHKEEFLDFVASLGVRNILEIAMQNYSALSVGQTIVIQYGNDKFKLDVVELKPGNAVSLYGTVDLKVEFAPVGEVFEPEEENVPEPIVSSSSEGGRRMQPRQPPTRSKAGVRRPMRTNSKESLNTKPNRKEKRLKSKDMTAKKKSGNLQSESGRSHRTHPAEANSASTTRKGTVTKNRGGDQAWKQKGDSIPSRRDVEPTVGTALNRKEKLAKFRKRNFAGLKKAEGADEVVALSKTLERSGLGHLDQGHSAKVDARVVSVSETLKSETVVFGGTGNVLSTGKLAPFQTTAAKCEPDKEADALFETNEKATAFSGAGKTLGGGSATVPANDWASIHRERHRRQMEKRNKEKDAKRQAEVESKRLEAENFALIRAKLESEQKERDLVKAEKDALVNAQRQELEKKVEEKLLRDQLIKQRKEEAIAARKRKKQEAADAKLAAQLSADEESRSKRRGAKSPAVGSAMSVARKQKKAEHSD